MRPGRLARSRAISHNTTSGPDWRYAAAFLVGAPCTACRARRRRRAAPTKAWNCRFSAPAAPSWRISAPPRVTSSGKTAGRALSSTVAAGARCSSGAPAPTCRNSMPFSSRTSTSITRRTSPHSSSHPTSRSVTGRCRCTARSVTTTFPRRPNSSPTCSIASTAHTGISPTSFPAAKAATTSWLTMSLCENMRCASSIGRPTPSSSATKVIHGGVPALAWRVELGGKVIVFSGDTNGDNGNLELLAKDADVFVAHNAIPEGETGAARALHMPPSVIGRIAAAAKVKSLVLSHRMLRSLGHESQTRATDRDTLPGAGRLRRRSRLLSLSRVTP